MALSMETQFNTKHVIEDFMKNEYEEGLRNEFNTMDALINKLPKQQLTGKLKYKTFKLGISDNIRSVGRENYDRYQLGMDDFSGRGSDTVDAQFDTTKLMATFAISDEAILKGTGDGSLVDVLQDQLNDMEVGLKHTYNRYIYGGANGIIGAFKAGQKISDASVSATFDTNADKILDPLRENRGEYHNAFRSPVKIVKFSFPNSHSLIQGMGCLVEVITTTDSAKTGKRYAGYIWQKDNSKIHQEVVSMVVEASYTCADATADVPVYELDKPTAIVEATAGTNVSIKVFSRQLDDKGAIAKEYTGLNDIVVTQNNTVFGVDRSVYTSLNCTTMDLEDNVYLNEEILRDLSDHLALTSPDGTAISLVAANHRIISQVEKQMYQFKNYNLDSTMGGTQLGGSGEIKFDNYVLVKDKYARDNNLYMLDQQKIGELVRRDFTWITSGEVNGILQRRPGTEMYEGIMNKYADMYIDAWRCHAVIKNCKVVEPGTYFSYGTDGQAKPIV